MLVFPCQVCKKPLSAEPEQAGQLVRCPNCLSTLRVPGEAAAVPAVAGAAVEQSSGTKSSEQRPAIRRAQIPPHFRSPGGGKRYGFNCAFCSSRLEATESMAGQEGQCPTCGSTIVIPIQDRYGRLIDPMTGKVIKQDPHPVHAYAAAGMRAPQIIRRNDGSQMIQCPRCGTQSPVSSNNCKSCGMPFTMEGTTLEASGASNGFCVASLVLGIIGIPAGCALIPALLAIIFGMVGYNQVIKSGLDHRGKGMAIAGMICGGLGLMFGAWIYLH
ncbi:MAG: DUF4190 domain-containing protein [Tepidisphaeraceae bacterium]